MGNLLVSRTARNALGSVSVQMLRVGSSLIDGRLSAPHNRRGEVEDNHHRNDQDQSNHLLRASRRFSVTDDALLSGYITYCSGTWVTCQALYNGYMPQNNAPLPEPDQAEELFISFANTLEYDRGQAVDSVPDVTALLAWLRERRLLSGRGLAAEAARLRRDSEESCATGRALPTPARCAARHRRGGGRERPPDHSASCATSTTSFATGCTTTRSSGTPTERATPSPRSATGSTRRVPPSPARWRSSWPMTRPRGCGSAPTPAAATCSSTDPRPDADAGATCAPAATRPRSPAIGPARGSTSTRCPSTLAPGVPPASASV